MNKKFLVFVEDPGAVNMVIDLPETFMEKGITFDFIANNHASKILDTKNIIHTKISNSQQINDFLKDKNYYAFLIGTSENRKSLS